MALWSMESIRIQQNGNVNSISTESPLKHWISSVKSMAFDSSLRWQRLHLSGNLFILASTIPNGTTNAGPPYLVQLFTEIQVQGEASFKSVVIIHVSCDNSMVNHVIQKGILWSSFKIDHKAGASGICPSYPTLANLERKLIGANLMGLRPRNPAGWCNLRRWIATPSKSF